MNEFKVILKKDKGSKALFLILLCLSVILSACIPLILVDFIDIISEAKSMEHLIEYVGMYLALTLSEMIVNALFDYYSSMREFNFTQTLKIETQNELFYKDGVFFENEKTGELLTIIGDDTAKIASFVYRVYNVIVSFLQAIAVLCVLMYYDLSLTGILLLLVPTTLLCQKCFEKKLHRAAVDNRIAYGNINSLTEEFVSNATTMIAGGYRKYYIKKFNRGISKLYHSFKKLAVMNEMSNQVLELITTLAMVLVTGVGGYYVFSKQITIGVLIVFLQYCHKFISPFENLMLLKIGFNLIKPSVERVHKILSHNKRDQKSEINEVHSIRFKNVSFCYNQDRSVLTKFNYSFEKSNIYLIRGESGIGKSTIVNLLLGLWDVDTGIISVNGMNLSEIDLEKYREKVAVVPQNPFFFHDTIYNNITLDCDIPEEKVWEVIKKVKLDDMIMTLTDGIHTVLGDDGKTISGGQRQRLAIARALLRPADVLVFDEPTSALDSCTEQIIANTIKDIDGRIVLIVSHSDCFLDVADYKMEMKSNHIVKIQERNR